MRKIFLMLTVSLFSLKAEAATCTPTPECASLGYKYSLEKCGGAAIKCPNGEEYYCAKPLCEIGDIYYSDNTCFPADKHDSTKTVLGIVVYVTNGGRHGQIMSPWEINSSGNKSSSSKMAWGDLTGVKNLLDFRSAEDAAKDFDSCANTDIIVAEGNADHYPAAWATRKYAPTPETAGKWCLPAAGILANIYNNQTDIQNAITKVGGVKFPTCCTWSSTEDTGMWAWYSNFGYDYGLIDSYDKHNLDKVRPVLEF